MNLPPQSDAETKIWDFYGLNRLVNKFQILNHILNYKFIEPFWILIVVFILFLGNISRLFAQFYRLSIDSKFEYHFVDLNKLNLNIYILMWFQQLYINNSIWVVPYWATLKTPVPFSTISTMGYKMVYRYSKCYCPKLSIFASLSQSDTKKLVNCIMYTHTIHKHKYTTNTQ